MNHLIDKLINILGHTAETKEYSYAMDFNSDLNALKNWLTKHLPNLEYTYINRNIEYNQQYVKGLPQLKDLENDLDQEFLKFQKMIRIQQG